MIGVVVSSRVSGSGTLIQVIHTTATMTAERNRRRANSRRVRRTPWPIPRRRRRLDRLGHRRELGRRDGVGSARPRRGAGSWACGTAPRRDDPRFGDGVDGLGVRLLVVVGEQVLPHVEGHRRQRLGRDAAARRVDRQAALVREVVRVPGARLGSRRAAAARRGRSRSAAWVGRGRCRPCPRRPRRRRPQGQAPDSEWSLR